ncbi:MAG: ATP-binding protein [Bacillota bacterium]
MTSQELQEILASLRQVNADTLYVEAKAARTDLPRDTWKTLSAFANTPGGGVIILGVDESHQFEPVGVHDPGKLQADLASICDRMVPPLRPVIEIHEIDRRLLVTVEIPELSYAEKPCYYGPQGLVNGAYIRVADGDRKLTQYEIYALLEGRQQPRYDVEPVADATLDELDHDLLQRFLHRIRSRRSARWKDLPDLQLLQTFKVVVDLENRIVPTLAGYLCFGKYPQERFPGICITFVRYPTDRAGEPGPAGERFLDDEKISGPIPVMVADALRAIKRNMRQREIIRGLFREEMWEYPEAVLREAIVNALGHRDYSPMARGSHVQIQMFPSRLTVLNPGGLFGPVTVDDLGKPGVQASRNLFLMNILEDLPAGANGEALCEHRGSGIAAMVALLRRLGMQPPTFEDRVTTFAVTFSNASLLDGDTLRWLEERTRGISLTDSQRFALAYLRHRSYIANADYCRLTGIDSRVATRELADLVAKGLLERQGTSRWTVYSLAPGGATQDPHGSGMVFPLQFPTEFPARVLPGETLSRREEEHPPARRRRQAALFVVADVLRRRREASAQELADATGLSPSAVRLALKSLTDLGLVEPTTQVARSPRRRYRWAGQNKAGS